MNLSSRRYVCRACSSSAARLRNSTTQMNRTTFDLLLRKKERGRIIRNSSKGTLVKRKFQKAVFVVVLSTMFSPARAIVIGAADSSNSIPFGSTTGGFFYQQVYNSASLSAPININDISFYNTISPGGTRMTGTFDLYLSTSGAQIATFDTGAFTFPDNSFVNVFHGNLPTVSNGRMDFNLSLSSFLYDPSQGNLVLTVKSFDAAAVGTDSSKWPFLDVDTNVGITNSRFSAFPVDWNQGLVTGFNDPFPVPLPAALPLYASGVGVLSFLGWRRRRRKTSA
jgi:hypothetical protein